MQKTQSPPFDPQDLERAGRALYGELWQSNLAKSLSVDSRRVRQWMAQEREPPIGVLRDVVALLADNHAETLAVMLALRKKYLPEDE